MIKSVAITGVRDVPIDFDLENAFSRYLTPFAGPETRFYLGGALGVDSRALLWLARHSPCALTVVVPRTMDQQPKEAQQAYEDAQEARGTPIHLIELRNSLNTEGYHARNRRMVDSAEFTVGFAWKTRSSTSGTWYTLDYTAREGKPRLIIPVG